MTSFADKCREACDSYFQKIKEEKRRAEEKLLEETRRAEEETRRVEEEKRKAEEKLLEEQNFLNDLNRYAEQIAQFMLKKAADGYVAYDIYWDSKLSSDYMECFFPFHFKNDYGVSLYSEDSLDDSALKNLMQNREKMELLAKVLRSAPYEFSVELRPLGTGTISLELDWEKGD